MHERGGDQRLSSVWYFRTVAACLRANPVIALQRGDRDRNEPDLELERIQRATSYRFKSRRVRRYVDRDKPEHHGDLVGVSGLSLNTLYYWACECHERGGDRRLVERVVL